MKCQICGRKIPLKADGTIRVHHFKTEQCAGSNRLPYELDGSAIEERLAVLRTRDQARGGEYLRHKELRLNEPLGASFFDEWHKVSRELCRLTGRQIRRIRLMNGSAKQSTNR